MDKVEEDDGADGEDSAEESEDANSDEDKSKVVESMLHMTQGQKMAGVDGAEARFVEDQTNCISALDRAATIFKQSEG